RTNVSDDPTFLDLLKRVKECAIGAYAHQDLPFERIVEELSPKRDLSRPPIVQVMFALQNVPMPVLSLAGLTLCPLELDSGVTRFDLPLALTEVGGRVSGSVEYNTDLFDAATIHRMATHFRNLLEAIVRSPRERLSRMRLLSEHEHRQLIVDWNATEARY